MFVKNFKPTAMTSQQTQDETSNPIPVFGAVGAIIEHDGKFLLVQEGKQKPDSGKWNQPAGWIDIGENAIQAVVREIKEETGLEFNPTGIIGIYSLYRHNNKKRVSSKPHVLKLIFRGNVTGGNLILFSEEISSVEWFTLTEIESMDPSYLRDPDIIDEIKDYLSGQCFPLEIITHTSIK